MKTKAKITVDELGGISYIVNGLEVCGVVENGKFIQHNHNSNESEKYFSQHKIKTNMDVLRLLQ